LFGDRRDVALLPFATGKAVCPLYRWNLSFFTALRFAPTNELGVVFLFSHLCRRMQLHVESVQAGFPDCIARQRVGGKERRVRIEFEFRSSSYRAHGHPLDGCDWIVCWEHDWPGVPSTIRVVELRRYFERGFNVWVVISPPQDAWRARGTHAFAKPVAKGDLVLFYEYSPNQWFRQICKVVDSGKVERYKSDSGGSVRIRYVHMLRRVCTLEPALRLKSLRTNRLIAIENAVFSQKHNRKITEHWWLLHDCIVRKYPECSAALEQFTPSRV
jgi:hypothetical protein